MHGRKIFALVILLFMIHPLVFPQTRTGSLSGTITDKEGMPLPGVTITANSPALMRTQSYLTEESGSYRFPALPPGTYTIRAEISGFEGVSQENIKVELGRVITINLTMEMSNIKKEITVVAASPAVDVKQTKVNVVRTAEQIETLPLPRDMVDFAISAPGAIDQGARTPGWVGWNLSFHGAPVRGNNFAIDGVNMADALNAHISQTINIDAMEEVELVIGSLPAEVGFTTGAYVNVVTRSGGNKFSGGFFVDYTDKGLIESLWTKEQAQSFKVSMPGIYKSWVDFSPSLGGPIIKDKLWFFSNFRLQKQDQASVFIPFTDILGQRHEVHNWQQTQNMAFFKLTFQLANNIKLTAAVNYGITKVPGGVSYGAGDVPQPYNAWEATSRLERNERTINTILNYVLNQNLFFDVKFNYVGWNFFRWNQDSVESLPYIRDYATPYLNLTSPRTNQHFAGKRYQLAATFNLFRDNFLGGNHEIKGGIDGEIYDFTWDQYRSDNLIWYWNGGPYFYSAADKLGYIAFSFHTDKKGGNTYPAKTTRFSAFLQDSWTFRRRLTLNIGARFDHYNGGSPAFRKEAAANPLSIWVGENIIRPYVAAAYPDQFPNGINPFEAKDIPAWEDALIWNVFSPRLGITYDLFGDGKTALKVGYNRYSSYLLMEIYANAHPFGPASGNLFPFYWKDLNGNAQPDTQDSWVPLPFDYRSWDFEFAKSRMDPNMKSPMLDEYSVGVMHELFKDFSAGLNCIYRDQKNQHQSVLYNLSSGQYLYHPDQAENQKYWIPFTTIVPGTGEYPDQTVTMYFRTKDAPGSFYRITTVPELKRKYWAFEFLFDKRFSDGWLFSGSVVFSKAYGNMGASDQSYPYEFSDEGYNGNYFVNGYGRIDVDRPLFIKLMTTVELPFGVLLSGYYRHLSGTPWNRTAYIQAPQSWAEANNVYWTPGYYEFVKIDPLGSRRTRSSDTLDLRIDKELSMGRYGRLGIWFDVYNIFGWSDTLSGMNDVFRYSPSAENTVEPTKIVLNASYQHIYSVLGTRMVKLGIRFRF